MIANQEKLDAWFEWRDSMRRKHRTMTLGEFYAWQRAGDVISHPIISNQFPGGLTVLLNTEPVVGKVDGWTEPPSLSD